MNQKGGRIPIYSDHMFYTSNVFTAVTLNAGCSDGRGEVEVGRRRVASIKIEEDIYGCTFYKRNVEK